MVWEFFDKITGEFNYKPDEVSQLSPLVLAYIGDAVYEVFIRTMLVSGGTYRYMFSISAPLLMSKQRHSRILSTG